MSENQLRRVCTSAVYVMSDGLFSLPMKVYTLDCTCMHAQVYRLHVHGHCTFHTLSISLIMSYDVLFFCL